MSDINVGDSVWVEAHIEPGMLPTERVAGVRCDVTDDVEWFFVSIHNCGDDVVRGVVLELEGARALVHFVDADGCGKGAVVPTEHITRVA